MYKTPKTQKQNGSPSKWGSEGREGSPLKNLKITFESLDDNGEGQVDKKILRQAIMYTGQNYDKQIILEEIEKCEATISLDKFMDIFQMAEIEHNQQIENESLFKMYDKAGKGYIDKDDLIRVSSIAGVPLSEQ